MDKNNLLNPEDLLNIKGGAGDTIIVNCTEKDSGYFEKEDMKQE